MIILKPTEAFQDRMQNRPDIAVKGFKKAGIIDSLAHGP